ncbi:MAG: zinc finger Ran-binding domain-containing protein [Actinomycetota bacterium]|nr:zinc finger Ran-binding domain-containing protein [Actinomycetota bacterium]
MSEQPKLRCPACGALAAPDAEWCSQCYEPLRTRSGHVRAVERPGPPVPAGGGERAVQPVTRVFEAVWEPPTNGHAPEASGASPALVFPKAPPPPVPVEPGPPLARANSGPELLVGGSEAQPAPAKRPVWNCPVCGATNDLELNSCPACGTPFTRLFEDRLQRPGVDPRAAAKRSLLFPGLGHIRIGRPAEGASLAVLFLWSIGTALLMLLAHAPGAGFIKGLAVAFLLAGLLAYALAAVDVFRRASGERAILSPRLLLYGTAGLVILSVGSLFIVVLRATHPH